MTIISSYHCVTRNDHKTSLTFYRNEWLALKVKMHLKHYLKNDKIT